MERTRGPSLVLEDLSVDGPLGLLANRLVLFLFRRLQHQEHLQIDIVHERRSYLFLSLPPMESHGNFPTLCRIQLVLTSVGLWHASHQQEVLLLLLHTVHLLNLGLHLSP